MHIRMLIFIRFIGGNGEMTGYLQVPRSGMFSDKNISILKKKCCRWNMRSRHIYKNQKPTLRDIVQQLLWKVEIESGEAVVLSTHTLSTMVPMLSGYQKIFRKGGADPKDELEWIHSGRFGSLTFSIQSLIFIWFSGGHDRRFSGSRHSHICARSVHKNQKPMLRDTVGNCCRRYKH